MAPVQPRLLVITCCVWCACCTQEECDAFAAVQDLVQVHRPHSPRDPSDVASLHLRKARRVPEGPTNSEFGLLRLVDRMLAHVLGSTGTAGIQKHLHSRGGYAHKVKMEWKPEEVEASTSVNFLSDSSCEESELGTQTCDVDLLNTTNRPRVEIRLAQPLNAVAKFQSSVDVNVFFLHQSVHVSCAVCAQPCVMSFLGKSYTSPRPMPCPVYSKQQWFLDLPFDGLMMSNLTNVPFDGSVVIKTKLVRNNKSTALSFTTRLLF